jgi:hypothetical protein
MSLLNSVSGELMSLQFAVQPEPEGEGLEFDPP